MRGHVLDIPAIGRAAGSILVASNGDHRDSGAL